MMQDIYTSCLCLKIPFRKGCVIVLINNESIHQCRITSFDLYKNPVFTKFDSLYPFRFYYWYNCDLQNYR